MSSAQKPFEARTVLSWIGGLHALGRRRPTPERGADADAPTAIPLGGWRDIVLRTVAAATRHEVLTVAAGITFYGMLAFIPALSAAASLYGLFSDAPAGMRQAGALDGVVPDEALKLILAELSRIAAKPQSQLAWTAGVALVGAVGSANAGMMALLSGLNVAYEEEECRSLVHRSVVAACFTAGLVLLVPLTFASLLDGRSLVAELALADLAVRACRFCFLAVMATGALALVYRYGPCRKLAKWRWVTPGGLLAAVVWLASSSAVSFYLAHFAHYERTYGVLGAVLAVMVWLWTAATVVLLGAELNAQIESQTERETAAGP
jgi:membrane protein